MVFFFLFFFLHETKTSHRIPKQIEFEENFRPEGISWSFLIYFEEEPIVHSILNLFHSEFKADNVMRNISPPFKSDVMSQFRGCVLRGAAFEG